MERVLRNHHYLNKTNNKSKQSFAPSNLLINKSENISYVLAMMLSLQNLRKHVFKLKKIFSQKITCNAYFITSLFISQVLLETVFCLIFAECHTNKQSHIFLKLSKII